MARMERSNRRLWVIILVLVVLLAGSNAAWIYYESQFAVTETETSTGIEQETDGGGNNYIVGGDYNGEATSKDNDKDANPNP